MLWQGTPPKLPNAWLSVFSGEVISRVEVAAAIVYSVNNGLRTTKKQCSAALLKGLS